MNKKLIVAAVSAAVMAPVAAHAESSFYARVNTAIDLNDLSSDGTTDISNVASRFGFKGSTDIGNGMTAHGRYEFSVNSDRESAAGGTKGTTGVDDVRIASVGLSGGFGRIDIGQQWSAYFNTFGTLISPTYSLGYYLYSSVGGGPYRASNTIKYSNSYGPVSLQLDVRLNESDEGADTAEKIRGDGIGLGLSFSVTDNITIAAAFDNEEGGDRAAMAAVAPVTHVPQVGTAAKPPQTIVAGKPATADDVVVAHSVYSEDGVYVAEVEAVVLGQIIGGKAASSGAVETDDFDAAVEGNPGKAEVSADEAPDTDRIGLAVKANFGGYWASLGWQNMEVDEDGRTGTEVDVDTTFLWVGGSLGEKTSWLIGYSKADDGKKAVVAKDGTTLTGAQVSSFADAVATDRLNDAVEGSDKTDDSTQLTWGVYHNLGGGIKLYYEATSLDSENNDNDGDRHLLGMRVDF